MKIKKFNDMLNESVNIVKKDWERMLNLVLTEDDGNSVAKLLKDKDKAISRFVAGLKLTDEPLKYNEKWKEYTGYFNYIGNKALKLGATPEEIQNVYDSTEVPEKYVEDLKVLSTKKLNNRFVGNLSRAILDAGFDINYLKHSGNAITNMGKEAMERNGRKWTIGYKAEVIVGDKTYNLIFDAITDEGDGPTFYVIDYSSDRIFHGQYDKIGKVAFIGSVISALKKVK